MHSLGKERNLPNINWDRLFDVCIIVSLHYQVHQVNDHNYLFIKS